MNNINIFENKFEKFKVLYDIYQTIRENDDDFNLYLSFTDNSDYIKILYKISSTPLFDIIQSLFSIKHYVSPFKFIINILIIFSTDQNIILVYKKIIEDIRIVSRDNKFYFDILLKTKNELNTIFLSLSTDYDLDTVHKMPVSKILFLLKKHIPTQ